ncbi:serine hydrolase domain-containing protein [uncultured Aquimarina sp.]|uniref:serine hydrolase domain-containing protein n=1 Tax=uncultured Aquimarina sp. TaxID=575652 RepID=UPI002612B1B3|nr:serine hydrolase domain-containing protein [uncultured Aquimarina sp.]
MKRIILILLFLSVYGQSICQINKEEKSSIESQIDSLFKNYTNVPGISIGVIKNNQLVYSKQFGLANLEYDIPISEATVFTLCSVSKQFTVLGLMLLVDEGLISLDDDIHTYIPELPDYGNIITLRHLANNTSGLRSNLQLLGLKGYTADDMINQHIVDEIIFRQEELNFKPGDEYNYSNSGFILLAKVIEKVSGKSFSQYIKDNIFDPLEMHDSFVMDDYQKIVKNKASSYEKSNDEFVFAPSNYSYVGASGIYTTIEDFSKWATNFTQMKVGNKNIFDEMNKKGVLNNGQESFYALGQIIQEYQGLKRIWHSGADAGYRSYIGRFPDQDLTFILLSNNASVYAEGEALKVADLFLKHLFEKNKKERISITQKPMYTSLSLKQKEELTGSYLSENYEVIRNIRLEEDKLMYIRPDQGNRKTELRPLNKMRFVLGTNENVQVLFNNDEVLKILVDNKEEEKYIKYFPKRYTVDELLEFTGVYYCDELETTYELKIENDNLIIFNSRIGTVNINSLKEDVFLGTSWIFNSLVFIRNKDESINGFRVSGQRVKHMYFKKVKLIKT